MHSTKITVRTQAKFKYEIQSQKRNCPFFHLSTNHRIALQSRLPSGSVIDGEMTFLEAAFWIQFAFGVGFFDGGKGFE